MKLKNYTSNVPVEKSISKIEALLVDAGARHINKEYDNSDACKGLSFFLDIDNITRV
jgi:hypothetical protein